LKVAVFGYPQRIGVVLDDFHAVVDLNLAYATYLSEKQNEAKPYAKANAVLPASLSEFLAVGDVALKAAEETLQEFVLPRLEAGGVSSISGPSGEKVAYRSPSEIKLPSPPIPSLSSRIFCAAMNFPSHVLALRRNQGDKAVTIEALTKEMKAKQIYGFCKLPQTIVGNDTTLNVPRWVKFLDYELELAAYVGKKGGGIIDGKASPITRREAKEMIVGYACFNDWSVRDESLIVGYEPLDQSTLNFTLRKNIAGGSLGPYLVIGEKINPYVLESTTRVNGKARQNGSLAEMVNKFEDLIVYLSRFITLYPGDIIASETVSGTALDSTRQTADARSKGDVRVLDDSLFLKDGDLVEGTISEIGTLRNRIHFV